MSADMISGSERAVSHPYRIINNQEDKVLRCRAAAWENACLSGNEFAKCWTGVLLRER